MFDVGPERFFVPRSAVWELTQACNMRCRFCRFGVRRGPVDELATAEALNLCRELAEAGCESLTLSGGEPLVREDWPLIARELVEHEVEVTLVTNGQIFTEQSAATAAEIGLRTVLFGLDGMERTHGALRRDACSWRRVLLAYEFCREAGVPHGAVTTICRTNLDELEDLHLLLTEEGVGLWQVHLFTPSPAMDPDEIWDLMVPPEALLDLVPLLAELKSRAGPCVQVGDTIGYYGGYEAQLRCNGHDEESLWMGCSAGCSTVGIESNGNIKGCLFLPSCGTNGQRTIAGNVRQRPFHEIWQNSEAFALTREFQLEQLQGFCRRCEYADLCRGGCVGASLGHGHRRSEPYYCYHRLVSGGTNDSW